jgi:hypothetical protein
MYSFKEDKIGITILEKYNSTSGKYTCFFGEHFNGTEECYDVGALNLINGELTRRHYISRAEAGEFWEEFKSNMRGTGIYESDERDEFSIIPPN